MKINISKKNAKMICEDMYGLFFEDINYGLDGGLSAELLENRNFEAIFAHGPLYSYTLEYDGSYGWELFEGEELGASIYCDSKLPLNDVNPHYLVFESKGSGCSFSNKAYEGLYLKAGLNYKVSFYLRFAEGKSDVKISVRKNDVIYAETIVKAAEQSNNSWKKYECILKPEKDVEGALFVVELTDQATAAFDWFSMVPEDAVCGIFRADLAKMLEELNPSFLRFPGGCVVEGNTMENRYQWKKSIGPAEQRKFNWNRWAVHETTEETGFVSPYSHYGQTLTVGYYEYFLLCEYLKAKALPVQNVGIACQYMAKEWVNSDSEEMEEYIQDTLDLIEFANGPADSEWGKKRTEMGHPEPFGLEYLGIGNEQWETEEIDFYKRYEMFESRIHEKYPEIKLIGSAGPDVSSEKYEQAWAYYKKRAKENNKFTYALDEHYYVQPEWLYDNVHFYDNYDRNIKVFAGEYACHIPGKSATRNCPEANTLGAALAEAAFLTGVERNADVVVLASYAPLFARTGYTQWSPDMIWFDAKSVYGTPSYYVQQMFSTNRGKYVLTTDWDKAMEQNEKVYMNAVLTETDEVILKIVNASDEEKILESVCWEGTVLQVNENTVVQELSGNPEDYNTHEEAEKVKTVIYKPDGKIVLKPHSFAVVRMGN